jgi:hypothetical protein
MTAYCPPAECILDELDDISAPHHVTHFDLALVVGSGSVGTVLARGALENMKDSGCITRADERQMCA